MSSDDFDLHFVNKAQTFDINFQEPNDLEDSLFLSTTPFQ